VFPRGDVWIGGDFSIKDNLVDESWLDVTWKVDGSSDMYLNVPNVKNVSTITLSVFLSVIVDAEMCVVKIIVNS
jgi:hypothetical protein